MTLYLAEESHGQVAVARSEPDKLLISLEPVVGKVTVSSSGQVMVLALVDQRVVEGSEATGTPLLPSGDLATVIASRCKDLSRLASEDRLIQRSLDLFRDALWSHARDILAGRESFEKLERTCTNVIGIVRALDESMLADTLSAHLEMIKSLFAQLDRLKHSGRDVLMDKLIASYTQAQERDQARLALQITSETTGIWEMSHEIEQLEANLGNKKEAYKTPSDSIQLLEDLSMN